MASCAPRRVPPLALGPQRQQQQQQQQSSDKKKKQVEQPTDGARQQQAKEQAKEQAKDEEDEAERLGERFLRGMAQLARLSRVRLDDEGGGGKATERRRSSVSLGSSSVMKKGEVLLKLQAKEVEAVSPSKPAATTSPARGNGGSPMKKERVVVNEATAPLQELLTFEISMLLPEPLDRRQRALQSPLRRKRRRRRRRKKRVRREWHASHATWVPHMATDYADAQEAGAWKRSDVVRLAEQMRALDARKSDDRQVPRSISLPLLPKQASGVSRRLELRRSCDEDSDSSEEEENEDEGVDGSGSEEDSDEEQAEDNNDITPVGLHASPATECDTAEEKDASCEQEEAYMNEEDEARAIAAADERRRAMQQHRPAWISPELREWLLASGLFATASAGSNSKYCYC